jgi:hypothetical protein
VLSTPRTVAAACVISFLIGLVFVFVWSPLPWGWEGIDHYHDRAQQLARGGGFDTTDYPWGYAYFVAAFYAVFGSDPLLPILAQVAINAITPLLVYLIARHFVSTPEARAAALFTGIFSFNTLYTATLAADSICTAIFLGVVLCYLRGRATQRLLWFASAGFLAGIAPQLRPNLVLFPGVLAIIELATAHRRRRLVHPVVILTCTLLALSPWLVRNYRLTQELLPTSTHGGLQLWYGTLQVGDYLESRAHNPRAAFEAPSFDYTTLAGKSIVVTAPQHCPFHDGLALEYWTDRDATPRRVPAHADAQGHARFEIPGQPAPTTVYYRVVSTRDSTSTPPPPAVYFVAASHLHDLDLHDDLLDVFDVVRMIRTLAWREPLRAADKLDFVADGRFDQQDLATALTLLSGTIQPHPAALFHTLQVANDEAVMHLRDGSWLAVPRAFSGKVTDLTFGGQVARGLIYARRSFATIRQPLVEDNACGFVGSLVANEVFYRKEPHQMRRYFALAYDNIARDPLAFVAASAYRVFRMFVVRGSDDPNTAQQFSASRVIYRVGSVVSLIYLLMFIAGAWLAVRRYPSAWLLLVMVAYVPVTIAPVLTNMRYTITVQPLAFIFVAVLLVSGVTGWRGPQPEGTRSGRTQSSSSQTAPRLW